MKDCCVVRHKKSLNVLTRTGWIVIGILLLVVGIVTHIMLAS